MLVAAHGIFSTYGHPQHEARTQTALLRRKHRAYQSLNEALQRNHQSVPDDVLGGIIMAIITESRLADAKASNAHLLGYEIAVRLRGGLRSIILGSSATQTSHMSHIMPYLACQPVPSESNVDTTTQDFNNFLNFFWGQVGCLGNMRSRNTDPIGDSGPSFMAPLKSRPFIREFLHDTELAGYLQLQLKESLPYMDQSSQFLSLYLIALTVYRLDNSQEVHIEPFLRHLCTVLRSSSTYDGAGNPLLTTQGFLWVVVKAVLDLGDMFYLGQACSQHRAQTIVDAVEALKVFRKMRSFLVRNEVISFLGRSLVTHKTGSEIFWRGGWVQEHDE
ncbi:hypothetical protein TCE0_060f18811 [Talaromyces pinophilus]|uniref:Uncharacterized protein n=1 Tax=Talaromyces pinophilus TaxID=128442 RepID=A0A6V8HP51_TALPI|nr:hypothetical protein TCE0_060f18811 [Talaromyces pinophilus]